MVDFKYDVAISCLDEDRDVASRIAKRTTRLSLTSFFYRDRQIELVGSDGIPAFADAFGRDSRTVAILYRAGWAQSFWTKLEETAIFGRYRESGPDVITLFRLDDSPVPAWFPTTRIWGSFKELGSKGAAASIGERVRAVGGIVRQESALEYAERLALQRQLDEEKARWLATPSAGLKADSEFQDFLQLCEKARAHFRIERPQEGVVSISKGKRYAVFSWFRPRETAKGAVLVVGEWSSPASQAERKSEYELACDAPDGALHWRSVQDRKDYSSGALLDRHLTALLERDDEDRKSAEAAAAARERERRRGIF